MEATYTTPGRSMGGFELKTGGDLKNKSCRIGLNESFQHKEESKVAALFRAEVVAHCQWPMLDSRCLLGALVAVPFLKDTFPARHRLRLP